MEENQKIEVLTAILKKIPLFSSLDETLHREIIQHIVLMYYPKDYTIFHQGDNGDAMYIVKNGTIQIQKEPLEDGDFAQKIAQIGENGFFGEMALISEVPRNATAKTLSECQVFILSKIDFKHLLDTNSQLAEQISSTVISRIKENNR